VTREDGQDAGHHNRKPERQEALRAGDASDNRANSLLPDRRFDR